MNPGRLLICILAYLLFYQTAKGQNQLEFSAKVQDHKMVTFEHQKLILIDFWATWCKPCMPATEQLQILQESHGDKVYIFGVSDEPYSKISEYLKRYNIKLAIYQDYNKNSFSRFQVLSRPYSVLLNLEGKMLWEGHPSDLNSEILENAFANNKHLEVNSLDDIIHISDLTIPIDSSHDKKEYVEVLTNSQFRDNFKTIGDLVYFEGELQTFIQHLLKLPALQIQCDQTYYLRFKSSRSRFQNESDSIIKELGDLFQLNFSQTFRKVSGKELYLHSPGLLWDKDQIEWEEEHSYLIMQSRIKGNNLSLNQFCRLLSDLKGEHFIYLGKDKKAYDWDLEYQFEQLMTLELKDSFGLGLRPIQNHNLKFIYITKK